MTGFPTVGDSFGRYQITGTLGRGGMGVVFSAVQSGLNRTVALKLLSPELAMEPQFRNRFIREATALATLDSPHVIHIYEHGEQDGWLFIATQLVAGGDLWQLLDNNGGLPPRHALDIVAQVSSALADAHDAGVIHRDIKPSNVLLHRSGDGELFAYLCDFGIAQTNTENRTRTGGLIGTLGYMAPERHEGAEASVSTDVYSLGCLLWAALTGKPPYEGSDVQVAIQHIQQPVPTYPGEDSVALAVNAILQRSMAKEPGRRYTSAAAIRADLAKAIELATSHPADAPRTGSRQASTLEYADPPVGARRRTPLLVGLATLVIIAALAGVGLWTQMDDPVTCDDGREVASQDDCRATTPSRQGESPSSSPAARTMRCWDGDEVALRRHCTVPRGLAGLRWVFPSLNRDFDRCRKRIDPTRDPAILSWACRFSADPDERMTYTEWTTPDRARVNYQAEYPQPPVDLAEEAKARGYLWRLTSPSAATGLYKVSLAYRNWPFSTSVYARSPDGLDDGCARLVLRSPRTFGIKPADCHPG